MKLSIVLLNVLLVGAGIFVYDAVRGGGDAPATNPPAARGIDRPTQADEPAPPPITLRGVGDQALLGELQRRIEALEKDSRRETVRLEAVADGGYEGANGRPATEVGFLPHSADPERPESFDPRDLESFRAMLDIVEQKRRDEQMRDRISRGLDRIDVALTDRQKQDVVDATITYQQKRVDLFRSGDAGSTREERQASMTKMRDEFQQTLYTLVPTAEADKIVESSRRLVGWGGGGSRRGGGGASRQR